MPDSDPLFVIQHHLATADHYDFRLEVDGVLASWAVPKGPSLDPRQRRMAKRVGDHEMSYLLYEGVLSEQRRGGGVVQVWDRGTYRNVSQDRGRPRSAADALEHGHLSFVLDGVKLRGGFSLIQTRGDELWLLIKKQDADADARRRPTTSETESVLTGRTMAQIEAAGVVAPPQ